MINGGKTELATTDHILGDRHSSADRGAPRYSRRTFFIAVRSFQSELCCEPH